MKLHIKALCVMLLAGMIIPVMAETGDAGHGKDYRTFHTSGEVEYGSIEDSYSSDLVMYLAGNQFMVMEELIRDFQAKNPDIKTVYVETIPPGQILKGQLLKQGEIDGQQTAMNPDIFASVNIGHLKKLKEKGLMETHSIYIHNKLELMIAAGNPKEITGPEDLGRDDLVQSHPNPLTEGIFKFYGSEMLKDMNLYEKVTGNAECRSCWATKARHGSLHAITAKPRTGLRKVKPMSALSGRPKSSTPRQKGVQSMALSFLHH